MKFKRFGRLKAVANFSSTLYRCSAGAVFGLLDVCIGNARNSKTDRREFPSIAECAMNAGHCF